MQPSTYLKETSINHILVWMPNWIGDVVFAIPTIQALRQHYPQSRITVVVRAPSNEFLLNHPDIDSVIRIPFKKNELFASLRFAWTLRKYRFDLGIVLPNSLRSAILTYIAKPKIRIGYNTDGRSTWLTDPIPALMDSKKIHGIDYYFHLLSPLGITHIEKKFKELVGENEKRAQFEMLSQIGIKSDDLVIAVQPGASKPEKRWHIERFGILCQRLIKEKGAKIILLGSKAEESLIKKVRDFCPHSHVFSLTGLNLQIVLGILKNCKLLVANDSGIMNLASLVDTPIVAIFGPGNPLTTDPCISKEKKEIVTKNFPCSPCRHNFFKECEPSSHNKPFCIEDISVIDVVEAVDRLLERVISKDKANN